MMKKMKIKKYKWILNRKDFKFIDEFCYENKIRAGKGTENNIAYLLNEYKLFLKHGTRNKVK